MIVWRDRPASLEEELRQAPPRWLVALVWILLFAVLLVGCEDRGPFGPSRAQEYLDCPLGVEDVVQTSTGWWTCRSTQPDPGEGGFSAPGAGS